MREDSKEVGPCIPTWSLLTGTLPSMLLNSSTHPGFPGGSDGKASACNAGDPGSIPGPGKIPGEGNGNPLQYPCLENPRSLVGYSPQGNKESDMTE